MVRPLLNVTEDCAKSMANNVSTKKVKKNQERESQVLVMEFSSFFQIFDIYASCEVIRA
jgi:hypothetical protein